MVFGGLLALGFRSGVAVFCGGLLAATALFAAISWRAGRHYD